MKISQRIQFYFHRDNKDEILAVADRHHWAVGFQVTDVAGYSSCWMSGVDMPPHEAELMIQECNRLHTSVADMLNEPT